MSDLRNLNRKLTGLAAGLVVVGAASVEAAAAAMELAISRKIGQDAPRRRVAGGSVGVSRHAIGTPKNPAELVKATGPLHLLANATKEHGITARRALALRTPYGPRTKVDHPGTPGKDTWHKGVDEGRPLARAAFDETAVSGVRRAFL